MAQLVFHGAMEPEKSIVAVFQKRPVHGQDVFGLAVSREAVGAGQDVTPSFAHFLDPLLDFRLGLLRCSLGKGIVKIDIPHQTDPPAVFLLKLVDVHGVGFDVGQPIHPQGEKIIEDGHQVPVAVVDPGDLDLVRHLFHPGEEEFAEHFGGKHGSLLPGQVFGNDHEVEAEFVDLLHCFAGPVDEDVHHFKDKIAVFVELEAEVFDPHAQVGVAHPHAGGDTERLVASLVFGHKFPRRFVEIVGFGIRQDDLGQVRFRLDQAVDDDVHSFHVLAFDEAGRGHAEVRVIDGQNLEDRRGEPGPRQGKELGHRGLFKIGPFQKFLDQIVVDAALHPGNPVGLL
jgi:hypothetical protein